MIDMAPTRNPWVIAVVDDEADMRRQLKEFLEGEVFSFGKVEVADTGTFEAALALLRERKIDVVILDVFRGGPQDDDRAGIAVLNTWRTTGFAPVILHTALPEGLEDNCSPFVRLVPKETDNLDRLVKELEALFALKIPQIHRAILDHLETSLRDYMWNFVVSNWQTFEGLVTRPDFARLLVHRLGQQFARVGVDVVVGRLHPDAPAGDPDPDKVHPAEYYIKPPLDTNPTLGDLREISYEGRKEIYVVVWPSCDLVLRDGKCKVDHALCARTRPVAELEEYQKWLENGAPSKGNAVKPMHALMANNRQGAHQPERFHFLPAAWDIPAVVVDFQQLEHIDVNLLRDARCIATVASPFAEAIGVRFVRYLGRLGTPDLDQVQALNAMRPVAET